jgi:ABC-2 type transport system permease protein
MALGQVMGGAYMIGSGVVEEKASRVVEVLVAKLHPRLLLTGKLVGLAAVLLTQLVLFVLVGLAAVALSPDLTVPDGLVAVSGSVLLWYLLAFAMYGSLFSVAGALSSRQEDMAQKMAPMMYVLFASFGAAFYAFGNPDALLTRIVSYVPFTAPAVLPARQASDALSVPEAATAIVVALLIAALCVRFAGRVYTAGALRTRGTSTLRRTLRGETA